MPTKKKTETIKELAAKLSRARLTILTDYRGLNTAQLQDLRRQLRPVEAEYQVAKNTLLLKAAEEAGIKALTAPLEGPTAVAFCYGDVVGPSKVLSEFAKASKILTIKAALLGDRLIAPTEVATLATLPSKEVLIGKLVGSLQAPIAGLVNVLNGPMRSLVYVLQARAKQLEGSAG